MAELLLKFLQDHWTSKDGPKKTFFKIKKPSRGEMGTFGGTQFYKIAARVLQEEILVVEKGSLLDAKSGLSLWWPPRKAEAEHQIHHPSGLINTLSLEGVLQELRHPIASRPVSYVMPNVV
jgi:hypothetical protein